MVVTIMKKLRAVKTTYIIIVSQKNRTSKTEWKYG